MKNIENAYSTVEETLQAIYRLISENGRSLHDIVVVTNSQNRRNIINSSPVEVTAIPTDTYQSIWSSIQTLFQDDYKKVLTDMGVDDTTARAYANAIRFGKYIVLVEERTYSDGQHKTEEENKSRLADARRRSQESMRKFGPGLDLDDPNENETFGRTPQQ